MYMILMGWGRRWGCACIDVYICIYIYICIFFLIYVYAYHDLTRIQYGFLTAYQVGYTSRKGSHLWCNCAWVAIWWWLQNCWTFNLYDGVDWSKGQMFLIKDQLNLPMWASSVLRLVCYSTGFQLSDLILVFVFLLPCATDKSMVPSRPSWSCWPQKKWYEYVFLHQIVVRLPTWWVGHFFDLAKRCPNLPGWAEECGGLV